METARIYQNVGELIETVAKESERISSSLGDDSQRSLHRTSSEYVMDDLRTGCPRHEICCCPRSSTAAAAETRRQMSEKSGSPRDVTSRSRPRVARKPSAERMRSPSMSTGRSSSPSPARGPQTARSEHQPEDLREQKTASRGSRSPSTPPRSFRRGDTFVTKQQEVRATWKIPEKLEQEVKKLLVTMFPQFQDRVPEAFDRVLAELRPERPPEDLRLYFVNNCVDWMITLNSPAREPHTVRSEYQQEDLREEKMPRRGSRSPSTSPRSVRRGDTFVTEQQEVQVSSPSVRRGVTVGTSHQGAAAQDSIRYKFAFDMASDIPVRIQLQVDPKPVPAGK